MLVFVVVFVVVLWRTKHTSSKSVNSLMSFKMLRRIIFLSLSASCLKFIIVAGLHMSILKSG